MLKLLKKKIIIKYTQSKKSIKTQFIIYRNNKSLLKKIHAWRNNREKASKRKVNKHTSCGYLTFTECAFKNTKKIGSLER